MKLCDSCIKVTAFLLIIHFLSVAATAQTSLSNQPPPAPAKLQGKQESPLPADIQSLLSLTSAVPDEFAADAMIRLISAGKVLDGKTQRALLETAYDKTGSAQETVKRVSLLGTESDTTAGVLNQALEELDIDALSLRCRIITLFLSLEANRALELLQEIPVDLNIRQVSCEDSLVPEPDCFYNLLIAAAKKSLSPKKGLTYDYLQLINRHISNLSSPTQVGPAAKCLLAVTLTSSQFTILISSFAAALKAMPANDRAFVHTMTIGTTRNDMMALAKACEQPYLRRDLLAAFRNYVIKNLNAERCSDTVKSSFVPKFISNLNDSLFKDQPLEKEDIRPITINGSYVVNHFWESPKAQKLLTQYAHLRFGDLDERGSGVVLSKEQRSTIDWKLELWKFLDDMRTWTQDDEKSEMDYFNQRCILYRGLFAILIDDNMVGKVFGEFCAFLKGYDLLRESRAVWLSHTKVLFDYLATISKEQQAKLLNDLPPLSNVSMQLYTALENIAPRTSGQAANTQ